MRYALATFTRLATTNVSTVTLTLFPVALVSLQEKSEVVSEALSPFRPDPPRVLASHNNSSERSGSPVVTVSYGKGGRLFVTNPSDTPRDSPTRPSQAPKVDDKNKEVRVRVAEVKEAPNGPSTVSNSGAPIAPVPAPSAHQKKSLFSRSKEGTRPNIRALGISQPVLNDTTNENAKSPFARMQTVDLETAAAAERARRETAASRTPSTPKSAPLLFASAAAGLRRSTSTKRKEIPRPEHEPMPATLSIYSVIPSEKSKDETGGSSTSACHPANRDEVRRRSPHYPSLEEKQAYQVPPSIEQRLPTAQTYGPMPTRQPNSASHVERVMLMNDIVYDNPGQIDSIISAVNVTGRSPGAPVIMAKNLERDFRDSDTIPFAFLPDYNATMGSNRTIHTPGSIMARPRPVKKEPGKKNGLFPADISQEKTYVDVNRRRSRSAGSLGSRKSLRAEPFTSANLQALPPLPLIQSVKSASRVVNLLPKGDIASTVDGQISQLFPAPPGVPPLSKRRSSVPSIVSLPWESLTRTNAANEDRISPAETLNTFNGAGNSYRLSANISQNITKPGDNQSVAERVSDKRDTFSQGRAYGHNGLLNNSTTAASIIPPLMAKAANESDPRYVLKPATTFGKPPLREIEDDVLLSSDEDDDEEISVMLESYGDTGKDSYLLDDDDGSDYEEPEIETPIDAEKASIASKGVPWHRRIGDELPTFSARCDQPRGRTISPPTPLLLSNPMRRRPFVVREAQPEPELVDSPGRALAEIQAQLQRFDERDRASRRASVRKIPADGSIGKAGMPVDRLLKDLENEMGLQENTWMKLKDHVDRDSILTPLLHAEEHSKPALSREASDASINSFRSGLIQRIPPVEEASSSVQNQKPALSKHSSRANMWQERLAKAQEEYLGNAAEQPPKATVNFLSINSNPIPKNEPALAYGTIEPKTTDKSDAAENKTSRVRRVQPLWQPSATVLTQRNSSMWTPPAKIAVDRSRSPELPALSLRPRKHRSMESMPLSSSSLWMKHANLGLNATRPVVGLWGSRIARPKSIQTRPVTQRPPRKSKRITFLPDIGT